MTANFGSIVSYVGKQGIPPPKGFDFSFLLLVCNLLKLLCGLSSMSSLFYGLEFVVIVIFTIIYSCVCTCAHVCI